MTPENDAPASDDEPQVKSWERFFKTYYREATTEAMLGWPARRSLVIDFFHLQSHDENLAEFLLAHPYEALAHAQDALRSIDIPGMDLAAAIGAASKPRLAVRVTKLPTTRTLLIRELRAEHLGTLVSVKARVVRATATEPKLQDAVFVCSRCGNTVRVPQDEHLVLQEPLECYEDQGGCGREAKFKLVVGQHRGQGSVFVDTQRLQLEELVGEVPDQPERRYAYAEDDLCGVATNGAVVTVVGVLRSAVRKTHGVKSTIQDTFIEINSISLSSETATAALPTEDEKKRIRELARASDVHVRWRDSIAPNIHGMPEVKLAIALQLFGGLAKRLPDGTTLRGDIHVLLTGDPGVAKSQLLRWVERNASPRGVYVSGKGSSGVGLTAMATRDELDGRWILEPGAMPRANGGHVFVDELDKLTEEDQSNLHEAMEQQTITISKAATGKFPARCGMLAAQNPKEGRFNDALGVHAQLDLPPALLSRFDVIFVLKDKPKRDEDAKLASHILDAHDLGARIAQGEQLSKSETETPIPKDLLKKWIAWVRAEPRAADDPIPPRLSPEARERIQSFWVNIRNETISNQKDDALDRVPATARMIESATRFAEASARLRLSEWVTLDDADRAISLLQLFMDQVYRDRDGRYDVDRAVSHVDHSERARNNVLAAVEQLHRRDVERGAEEGAIIELCAQRGMTREETLRWLAELTAGVTRRDGPLWSGDTPNFYKLRRLMRKQSKETTT